MANDLLSSFDENHYQTNVNLFIYLFIFPIHLF